MVVSRRRQRAGGMDVGAAAGFLLAALVFFVGFAALTAMLLFRERDQRNEDLVRQLQTENILDDAVDAGWPQWRGPHRDGVTTAPDLLVEWPKEGPRLLWRAETGPGYSSVSVANGRAYTLFQGDGRDEVVICWDAVTGDEKWRFSYPGAGTRRDYPGTRSTPTVDGNQVFTLGGTGILCCLEATTGKELWKLDLLAEFHAESPQWGMAASPLVLGDRVLVNPGGKDGNSLAALDRNTGHILWRGHDFPAGYSSPVVLDTRRGREVVFFTAAGVVSVSPEDGGLLWQYPWVTDFGVNAATPLWFRTGTDDYLFITSDYGKGCALLKVPSADPEAHVSCVYTNNQLLCKFSSPVRVGDYVYGISDPGSLTCMDLRTGEVIWREKKFSVNGSLLAARTDKAAYLLVLSERGDLALVEPSPEGYREKAFCRVFRQASGNWSTPALVEGRLYVRNGDEVHCLDLHKQALKTP